MLNQCNYIVLDEADRMIDMGFEPQVGGGRWEGQPNWEEKRTLNNALTHSQQCTCCYCCHS